MVLTVVQVIVPWHNLRARVCFPNGCFVGKNVRLEGTLKLSDCAKQQIPARLSKTDMLYNVNQGAKAFTM